MGWAEMPRRHLTYPLSSLTNHHKRQQRVLCKIGTCPGMNASRLGACWMRFVDLLLISFCGQCLSRLLLSWAAALLRQVPVDLCAVFPCRFLAARQKALRHASSAALTTPTAEFRRLWSDRRLRDAGSNPSITQVWIGWEEVDIVGPG